MKRASFARVVITASIGLCIILCSTLSFAHAQTTPATTLDSTICNQLYGLPTGTISTIVSAQYLNPTVCAAMQDLITRYNPGTYSKIGLSNAKVQGITSLNSTFAVNLDTMLKAADAAGYHITINSAYRTVAAEAALNPSAFAGKASASMHTKGLAADLQYPNDNAVTTECDGTASNLSAAYQWVYTNDAKYNLGQYDQLHAHVKGECNHVEERAGTSNATLGPGANGAVPTTPLQSITNALGITTPSTAQTCPAGYTMQNNACTAVAGSNIFSTPGLGSTPSAGQILGQDSSCIISTNPVITVPVPAGTAYPSGCLNGALTSATSYGGTQLSCSGNTVVYNSGSAITPIQVCTSICSNGACIQQSCPVGYTLVNGLCNQTAQVQQAAQQAASTASNPASTATTPASNASQTSPAATSASTPSISTSAITAPTLVPNLGGSSTLALIQALANPLVTTAGTTSTVPIVLGSAATDLSQLEASPLPGVTYAQPTSNLFPSSGNQSGTPAISGNASGNGITTTAGTGYDTTGGTDTGTQVNSGTSDDITSTQTPGGADTFGSGTVTNPAGSGSFSGTAAPSTFASGALSILATLKAQLLGAIDFLANYVHPASVSQQTNQAANQGTNSE